LIKSTLAAAALGLAVTLAAPAPATSVIAPGAEPAAAAAPTGLSSVGATVAAKWWDADHRLIRLRYGTYDTSTGKGFGWIKIQVRHRILSMATVRFVTKAPNGGVKRGNSRTYTAYANRKVCTKSSCFYTDSVPVKAGVAFNYVPSYYGVLVNGVLGVKTTYCVNPGGALACPWWVDRAMVGIPTKASTLDRETVTSVELSYKRVTLGVEL
jgi:hypothetical protein